MDDDDTETDFSLENLLKGGEHTFVVKFDIWTSLIVGGVIFVSVLAGGWIARQTS